MTYDDAGNRNVSFAEDHQDDHLIPQDDEYFELQQELAQLENALDLDDDDALFAMLDEIHERNVEELEEFDETGKHEVIVIPSSSAKPSPSERQVEDDDVLDSGADAADGGEQQGAVSKLNAADEETATQYRKMLKMGMPDGAVQQKMLVDGISQNIINSVIAREQPAAGGDPAATTSAPAAPTTVAASPSPPPKKTKESSKAAPVAAAAAVGVAAGAGVAMTSAPLAPAPENPAASRRSMIMAVTQDNSITAQERQKRIQEIMRGGAISGNARGPDFQTEEDAMANAVTTSKRESTIIESLTSFPDVASSESEPEPEAAAAPEQAPAPPPVMDEASKRRAVIVAIHKDKSLTPKEKQARIQEIMKGGISAGYASGAAAAAQAPDAAEAPPAPEAPPAEETAEEAASRKRKAIQAVYRDTTLTTQEKHQRAQAIQRGEAVPAPPAAAAGGAAAAASSGGGRGRSRSRSGSVSSGSRSGSRSGSDSRSYSDSRSRSYSDSRSRSDSRSYSDSRSRYSSSRSGSGSSGSGSYSGSESGSSNYSDDASRQEEVLIDAEVAAPKPEDMRPTGDAPAPVPAAGGGMRRSLFGRRWGRNSRDAGGADDFAYMFVKPTLTDEQRRKMERDTRDGKNRGSVVSTSSAKTAKPVKFKVGTNMQALRKADRKKMTVAEKQKFLKGKYKAKHDIGDFSKLKKAKQNSQNKGEKTEIPPVSLRKVCAPQLKLDLKKFKPTETKKTEWQTKILKKVIGDSVILRDNAKKTEDRLIAAMKEIKLKSGQILSKQGEVDEKDDKYYVVESGRLEFQVDGVTVDTAEAGTAFNEERLLYRHANKANIKASEDTKLLELDQTTFRGIMQEEEIKTQKENPKAKQKEKSKKKKKKTRTIAGEWDLSDSTIFQEQEKARLSIKKHASSKDDLEFIQLLGEGRFGEVWLVGAKLPEFEEKQQFALKMQDITEDELREDPTDAIWKEVTALKILHHPFVVNLAHVYETETSIDMLLGLIRGTELWDEVRREDEPDVWVSGFSEARARFYTVVLTDTLAFLHKHEFCYRDFKPENVMIDEDGYPILVDFGFAKHVAEGDKTFTFCGTPNYVAPEIIKLSGHDRNVDYWALGVVIYEMVCGESPFFYEGMEQFALYQAITDEAPCDMEGNYTEQVIDLCHKLLDKDATKRLGSNHPHDILEHDWFRGTPDLSEYRAKKVVPPPLVEETISFEVAESEEEEEPEPASAEENVKDAVEELDLFEEPEKTKPKIKLVPFKTAKKGGLKGYFAKEKTKEEKLSSKERRRLLSAALDPVQTAVSAPAVPTATASDTISSDDQPERVEKLNRDGKTFLLQALPDDADFQNDFMRKNLLSKDIEVVAPAAPANSMAQAKKKESKGIHAQQPTEQESDHSVEVQVPEEIAIILETATREAFHKSKLRTETLQFLDTLHGYLACRAKMDAKYTEVDEFQIIARHTIKVDTSEMHASAKDPWLFNSKYQQQSVHGRSVATLSELYEAAEQTKPIYQDLVNQVVRKLQTKHNDAIVGMSVKLCDLKGKQRAQEKADDDYAKRRPQPGVSWLYDIVRGSVEFTSAQHVIEFLDLIQQEPSIQIIKAKNRFTEPSLTGYRDLNIQFQVDTQKGFYHTCELQIHHKAIKELDVELHTHMYYEFFRSYFAGATSSLEERLEVLMLISDGGAIDDSFLTELLQTSSDVERLERLGVLFRDQLCEYQWAFRVFVRLFDIRKDRYGTLHPEVAGSYNDMALVLKEQGKLDEAMELYQQSLEIYKAAYDDQHTSVAKVYFNMALVLKEQEQLAESMELFQKSLMIDVQCNGEDSFSAANTYNHMAAILRKQGKLDEAMGLFQKSLDSKRRLVGDVDSSIADTLQNIAIILKQKDKLEESKNLFQESIDIATKSMGEKHSSVAVGYRNMALVLEKQGKLSSALEFYRKSLDIYRKNVGEKHLLVADIYNDMAYSYKLQGNRGKAKGLLLKSLSIKKKLFAERVIEAGLRKKIANQRRSTRSSYISPHTQRVATA